MKPTTRIATLAAVLVLATALPASAATWEFDKAHSAAGFAVRHLMISTVRGEFHNLAGAIEWDGKEAASVKIDATVDVATVDTREPKRDAHLKTPDFFDAEKFPTMSFKSKKAESAGTNKMKVTGDLTIRGVTKEVTLDVEFTPIIKDPWGNEKFGATATTTIDRTQFGVLWNKTLDAGGVVVSNNVTITIDAELAKKKEPPVEKK